MKVKVHSNGDDTFIAWKPDGFIPGCRGFALMRKRNGIEEVVSTWVGFAGDKVPEGERRASTNWPIQKYQWTDYMANPGDKLQYRILPMIGADKANLSVDPEHASQWTAEITLGHEAEPKIEAYFNRGIVASQWISRRLDITNLNLKTASLRKIIGTTNDPMRNFLAGDLGRRLFELLESAAAEGREIYAALYELKDDQLETALEKLGKRAHVVLANASAKSKEDDPNAAARERLASKIDLHDRMSAPRALGHNKFLVICDKRKKPRWVWTGSQNWTETGLCTQANNSVLIDNFKLAGHFRSQWNMLRDAGNGTPAELKKSNSEIREVPIGGGVTKLWFTPTVGQVDLEDARAAIESAQQAVLFLMFNPGPKDTLLNGIIALTRNPHTGRRLYIHGAINQDPSTSASPVELFGQENSETADFEVVLPAAIDTATEFFRREMKKLPGTFAMIHSKVVLVDPFGEHPVLITGSHNLGPKASGTNDENLLIIRGAPRLAAAYATNIMSIYNQYRWRFRRGAQPKSKQWKGLEDGDAWQRGYLEPGGAPLREIDFWVGE